MIGTLSRCGSAFGLVFLLLATPVLAFEPMPPIMQTLLEVFPEENGCFVDEPFGATSEMPAEARQFFETFRVVVPSVDDIEKSLARLFASSSRLPIKKITRYDRNPGAPGLPGFRGVWCQTEDGSQIGFSIVTINQNRFLIWAKMGYYPFFANDSVNPKVRDQYARDVSQYLAGLDLKVPDNEAPPASGRGLPEGMDLFWHPEDNAGDVNPSDSGYGPWGINDLAAFVPKPEAIHRFIDSASTQLWWFCDPKGIQRRYTSATIDGWMPSRMTALDSAAWRRFPEGEYAFAVDRFGRIRTGPGQIVGVHALLFPDGQVLSVGDCHIVRIVEGQITALWGLSLPESGVRVCVEDHVAVAHQLIETFGHFLAAWLLLNPYPQSYEDVLIDTR